MTNEKTEQKVTIEEPAIPSTERPFFIPPPAPIEPEERVEAEPVYMPEPTPEPEPEEVDELADLFTVPLETDNDMKTAHLLSIEDIGDDDLSDLVEVSHEDIMGDGIEEAYPGTPASVEPPEPTRRFPVRRYKRTPRRFQPLPPTGMTGIRG